MNLFECTRPDAIASGSGRLLFDWSLDGKQLVFTRRVWTPDLVLLRNFMTGKL
ncbi:MAG TPA: hypothetical protein VLD57_10600 [Blastocatellia bacterium]|nr:hypothetical protein [Blastocatellia bacterium]